jgi:hypothetical protein
MPPPGFHGLSLCTQPFNEALGQSVGGYVWGQSTGTPDHRTCSDTPAIVQQVKTPTIRGKQTDRTSNKTQRQKLVLQKHKALRGRHVQVGISGRCTPAVRPEQAQKMSILPPFDLLQAGLLCCRECQSDVERLLQAWPVVTAVDRPPVSLAVPPAL